MNHANAKGESLPTFNDSVQRQAGAEASTIVAKRLVFHLGGYDPITPYVVAQRRFVRELTRFERTWSAKASMGALDEMERDYQRSKLAGGIRLSACSLGRRHRRF